MTTAPAQPPANEPRPRVTFDPAGYVTGWNKAAETFFGFSNDEAMGRHLLFLAEDENNEFAELAPMPNGADTLSLNVRRRNKDGRAVAAHLTLRLLRDADGEPQMLEAVYEPHPERTIAPNRLQLYVSIIEDSHQGVMVTDANERIVMVNPAFTRITGYSAEEALGQTPDILRSGKHGLDFRAEIHSAMKGAGLWLGEILGRRKNGEVFPQSVCISTTRDEHGQVTHAFSIFSDISAHKETETRLQRLANFDSVTGLPNRLLLKQLLEQNLSQAKRSGDVVGVLVVQLQRLGWVYDTLGHDTGDELVTQVAARLQDALREQDILARLGHDKLAVVLPNLRQREHAGLVAQKLLGLLRAAYFIGTTEVHCPASVGIAVYPDNGQETAALLRCAEVANTRGLEQAHGEPTYFSEEMNQRANERFRIENELRHALHHGELMLYHQPKVSLRNGRIVGAEALLRWQHPRHGLMTPGNFVPVAEETSLILELGEWVLDEACRQLRDWNERDLHMPPMAVNLSARQFDKQLPRRLDRLLSLYGVAPQQLKLEITESLMVRGADEVTPIMNELAAMGLGIALDDFGTGYSSLAYLKKFPITTLKIDRSFVVGIPTQANDCAIAQAIVTMGQQLRQEIVAEGVENRAQMVFLRNLGCDQLQGYLFSPPVAVDRYETMVRDDVRLSLDP
jgi:diguanylate cyclase (GGDEF)-like protein/PAS domain S-box-containing protein